MLPTQVAGSLPCHRTNFNPTDEDEEDDDLSSPSENRLEPDNIRRQFVQFGQAQATNQQAGAETIQVQLDEKFLARERRALFNAAATLRSKWSQMQMFNPVKNQAMREQQEHWSERERYTLDSLNEIKRPADDRFQWTRPRDGREVWSSKLQYFLAITSYSIGLGNVIRFPILVQRNGGLAFIIPFVIMLLLEGIPLFYLELAVGQRMRKAAISCWNLVSPSAAGIGLASCAVSFIVGLYYNTMVAWTLLYLFDTLAFGRSKGVDGQTAELPFAACPMNASTIASDQYNQDECQTAGPFQYYWFRETLNASSDVNNWSNFNWPVAAGLLIAWAISYVCLVKGLSGSKRVVYLISIFPYVILTVFFFKAISLNGMSDGIYYLFAPQWSRLAEPYIWLQAAAQVFFSLGLGFGGLIALSSYNPVNNNCYRDAVKVALLNFLTSVYAGVVIFAILGYKANLSFDRCELDRAQKIDFYMSDYALKAIDYGSAFSNEPPPTSTEPATWPQGTAGEGRLFRADALLDAVVGQPPGSKASSGVTSTPGHYETTPGVGDYDAGDAIDANRALDKLAAEGSPTQADGSSFQYNDGDEEFTVNASDLISGPDLARIISNIPGLPTCSVQKELDEASQGTGLVFVVIAEAISQFENSAVWAIIFFLMLFTLGLDSQFGNLEGLLSSIADLNFAQSLRRQWVTGLICILSLVVSLLMFAHGAGSHMFAIFDEYAGSFSLVLIALFELVTVSYIYGLKRFCDDCELMTGQRPSLLIMLSWRYISPLLLVSVIFATVREFTFASYYDAWEGGQIVGKPWPSWCLMLGAGLIIVCVIWIPAIAVLHKLGLNIIPEENINQCWFPAEDLREFHDIQEEHKVTELEGLLFGFRPDDD